MGFTIKVLSNDLGRLSKELRPKASAIVKKTAFEIEASAKQRAAVDTGAMRSSITTTMDGDLSATVSVGAEYGPYQEYGTAFQPGTPFMTPAAEAARAPYAAAMRKILE